MPDNRAIALEYITLVRVFAQYLSETAVDPQAAAYDIGRTWAKQISTEPYDESELLVRLTQMGFDPVPLHQPDLNNQTDHHPDTRPGASLPIIELRSCPFLHPHKDTPATVCDIHMGMLAAREGINGQRFTLIPHSGDALCYVAATNNTVSNTTGVDATDTTDGDADANNVGGEPTMPAAPDVETPKGNTGERS